MKKIITQNGVFSVDEKPTAADNGKLCHKRYTSRIRLWKRGYNQPYTQYVVTYRNPHHLILIIQWDVKYL